jgi:hypothetical protein
MLLFLLQFLVCLVQKYWFLNLWRLPLLLLLHLVLVY